MTMVLFGDLSKMTGSGAIFLNVAYTSVTKDLSSRRGLGVKANFTSHNNVDMIYTFSHTPNQNNT
jgi:hypothetical protein